MAIFRAQHNKNYTCINNHICTDRRLSWKAKGLWLYAFSRPDDWTFHTCDLINQATDGRDAVRGGLRELELAGYLVRTQMREIDGKIGDVDWIFHELPQPVPIMKKTEEKAKKPLYRTGEPQTGFPSTENRPLLSTEAKQQNTKAKTVIDSKPSSSKKAKTVTASPIFGEVSESLPFLSEDLSSKEGGNIQETQKDTERPLESTIDNEAARRLSGIKQPLKREQLPLLEALTELDLGCDLSILYILIRSHDPKALTDAIHHIRYEDGQGKKFGKRIAFFRSILAGKISPITEQVEKNKKLCAEKSAELGWHSIDIREKFVVCAVTHKEISLSLPAEEFFNALKNLYELGQSYRKIAPESFDLGYDDGREDS